MNTSPVTIDNPQLAVIRSPWIGKIGGRDCVPSITKLVSIGDFWTHGHWVHAWSIATGDQVMGIRGWETVIKANHCQLEVVLNLVDACGWERQAEYSNFAGLLTRSWSGTVDQAVALDWMVGQKFLKAEAEANHLAALARRGKGSWELVTAMRKENDVLRERFNATHAILARARLRNLTAFDNITGKLRYASETIASIVIMNHLGAELRLEARKDEYIEEPGMLLDVLIRLLGKIDWSQQELDDLYNDTDTIDWTPIRNWLIAE